MRRSRTIIASPPGATVKEQLLDRVMSQKEFAKRMDISEKHISRLINGEVQLTPDMAIRLEMVLGIPAQFWSSLESVYREKLAKVNAENEMEEDIELAKKMPYIEMAKNGWVPETSQATEKVINLRKFFEVVQLSLIQGALVPGIACRRLAENKKSDYALFAWAQKAKLEARQIDAKPISINRLLKAISHIRKMTKENPETFYDQLIRLLGDCGIAIVFLPHFEGSFLHGTTFYDGDKIVMGLTVRGKDADRFWFSLFHEIAHIVQGHIGQPNNISEADEFTADEFAKETLIPSREFELYAAKKDFSKQSLVQFANEVGIDAGILVGRLQKEGYIEYNWFNELKTKYVITADI
jgi:HTH-type transcriptional regulator / antitoxin HigA